MLEELKVYYQKLLPQMTEEDWMALQEKVTIKYLKRGEYLTKAGDLSRKSGILKH